MELLKQKYFNEVLMVEEDDKTLSPEQRQKRVSTWNHHLHEIALQTILFLPFDQRFLFQKVCNDGLR